jgi:hypothetical protein
VHKRPIDEAPLLRVRCNVAKLSLKIVSIADPMLVKARLPDLSGELFANLMRKASFYALRAPLNGLPVRRRQQNVQVFRHHHEPMQQVPPLIPIMEQRFH